MVIKSVLFLHHTAAYMKVLLEQFNSEIFYHSHYSQDLTPRFTIPSSRVRSGWLPRALRPKFMDGVNNWLDTLATLFCAEKFQEHKCLNMGGDYMEK